MSAYSVTACCTIWFSKHNCLQGLGKTITALALILKTRGLEPALPNEEVCRRRDGSGHEVAFYTGA